MAKAEAQKAAYKLHMRLHMREARAEYELPLSLISGQHSEP